MRRARVARPRVARLAGWAGKGTGLGLRMGLRLRRLRVSAERVSNSLPEMSCTTLAQLGHGRLLGHVRYLG